MGLTKDQEARASTSDAEEMLPLYTETEGQQPDELKSPAPEATADEVRDFLVQVLQKRGIDIDHTRRVAARWNVGSGRELRSYPVGMFRDIFGVEDGWLVYMGVRTIQYREEEEKKPSKWAFAAIALIPLLIFCGSVAILQADDVATLLIPLAVIGLMIGGLGVPAILIPAFCSSDPEEKAEDELKSEWYKAPSAK